MMLFLLLLLATFASIAAAQRLAVSRGRPARSWMVAAALLGPLPLIPLAALRRR